MGLDFNKNTITKKTLNSNWYIDSTYEKPTNYYVESFDTTQPFSIRILTDFSNYVVPTGTDTLSLPINFEPTHDVIYNSISLLDSYSEDSYYSIHVYSISNFNYEPRSAIFSYEIELESGDKFTGISNLHHLFCVPLVVYSHDIPPAVSLCYLQSGYTVDNRKTYFYNDSSWSTSGSSEPQWFLLSQNKLRSAKFTILGYLSLSNTEANNMLSILPKYTGYEIVGNISNLASTKIPLKKNKLYYMWFINNTPRRFESFLFMTTGPKPMNSSSVSQVLFYIPNAFEYPSNNFADVYWSSQYYGSGGPPSLFGGSIALTNEGFLTVWDAKDPTTNFSLCQCEWFQVFEEEVNFRK